MRNARWLIALPLIGCASALQHQPESLLLDGVQRIVIDTHNTSVTLRSGVTLAAETHVEWTQGQRPEESGEWGVWKKI